MQIGILSRNASLYSTRSLVLAGRRRGHRVMVLDTLRLAMSLDTKTRFGSTINRKLLRQLDGIIPRIGTSISVQGVAVVQMLEEMGLHTTATATAIDKSRNKLATMLLLKEAGLPYPATAVVRNVTDLARDVAAVGGLPVILKPIRGTQGRGIHLLRTMNDLRVTVEILRHAEPELLMQHFIAEAEGNDTRIIVVQDRCVAAMERRAPAGDFRANLHQGGTAIPLELDKATETLAIRAAQAVGLGVAGVDLIKSADGYKVLEINSSPGLEGIEGVTGIDVAVEIVRYLERLKPGRQRRRRRSSRSRRRTGQT